MLGALRGLLRLVRCRACGKLGRASKLIHLQPDGVTIYLGTWAVSNETWVGLFCRRCVEEGKAEEWLRRRVEDAERRAKELGGTIGYLFLFEDAARRMA